MAITKFKINNTRTEIALEISLPIGDTVSNITLWNEVNYKDPVLNTNLNYKIQATSNEEIITISYDEAFVNKFDGIYIIEIESANGVKDIKGTMAYSRISTIIATMLCGIKLDCLNCNSIFQNVLIIDLYLESIKNSMNLGRFFDAIMYLKKINKLKNSCNDCPPLNDMNDIITP